MPWPEVSTMSLRTEFVHMAETEAISFAELCRRFQVSRKTGYKWQQRFRAQGLAGLANRSRRPHHSPARLPAERAAQVVAIRRRHPKWGALKIQARLEPPERPSTSTINRLLRREGLLDPTESLKHRPWQRFEHAEPNDLWQMDFKGHFALPTPAQARCYPLTILDDHSRFALGLYACPNTQTTTVQACLTEVFRRYGLPYWMTMDNGAPWGDSGLSPYTALTVWLMRLGIGISHSRPGHPQTQGKDERFHRTLQTELLEPLRFRDWAESQAGFDRWRAEYNQERPHQALGMAVPASRYHPSPRAFPEILPAIEYSPGDEVRKVQQKGELRFRGRCFRLSKAFYGYPVGLRPTQADGVWDVYFCSHKIGRVELKREPCAD